MVENVSSRSVSVEVEGQVKSLQVAIEDKSLGGDSLPAGGTTGQVLAKETEADGDVGWVSPAQKVLVDTEVTVATGFLEIPIVLDFTSNRKYSISLQLVSGYLTTPANYVNSANKTFFIADFLFNTSVGSLRSGGASYVLDQSMPSSVRYIDSTYQPEVPLLALPMNITYEYNFHEASMEFTIESGNRPAPPYLPTSTILTMYGRMKSSMTIHQLNSMFFEGSWKRDILDELPDGLRFKAPSGTYRVKVIAI